MPGDPTLGLGSNPSSNAAVGSAGAAIEAVKVAAEEDEAGFVDRRVDLAICLTALVLGLFLIYASYGIRRGSIPDPIGSGGWSRVIGIAMAVIAGTLVFRRLAAWRGATSNLVPSDGGKDGEAGYPSSGLRPVLLVAAGAGWILALPRVGFLIATFAVTVATIAAMQVRSFTKLIVVPFLFTLCTWLLFGQVFGIHFPARFLEKALQGVFPGLQ
jgi:hypothetical protein